MRLLLASMALVGFALTGLVFATPSAEAAGICTYEDTYNNMGDHAPCGGIVCYGHTMGSWQNCVYLIPPPCTTIYC